MLDDRADDAHDGGDAGRRARDDAGSREPRADPRRADHHGQRHLCARRAAVRIAVRLQAFALRATASASWSARSAKRRRPRRATRRGGERLAHAASRDRATRHERRPDCGASCAAISTTSSMMAMRKEPERRYSSVEQIAADIERYLRRHAGAGARRFVGISHRQVRAPSRARRRPGRSVPRAAARLHGHRCTCSRSASSASATSRRPNARARRPERERAEAVSDIPDRLVQGGRSVRTARGNDDHRAARFWTTAPRASATSWANSRLCRRRCSTPSAARIWASACPSRSAAADRAGLARAARAVRRARRGRRAQPLQPESRIRKERRPDDGRSAGAARAWPSISARTGAAAWKPPAACAGSA